MNETKDKKTGLVIGLVILVWFVVHFVYFFIKVTVGFVPAMALLVAFTVWSFAALLPNKEERERRKSELEFLRWFYAECDFGPEHEDVVSTLKERFERSKNKRVPKPYRID